MFISHFQMLFTSFSKLVLVHNLHMEMSLICKIINVHEKLISIWKVVYQETKVTATQKWLYFIINYHTTHYFEPKLISIRFALAFLFVCFVFFFSHFISAISIRLAWTHSLLKLIFVSLGLKSASLFWTLLVDLVESSWHHTTLEHSWKTTTLAHPYIDCRQSLFWSRIFMENECYIWAAIGETASCE